MERYLIRYFLAVVEAGAFSRAAARLNVAQPTVSIGVAKLEQELGVKLLQRTSRRVHLTDDGARFLAHARAIEAAFNTAASEMSRKPARKALRVGLLTTLSPALIEDVVRRSGEAAADLELLDGSERELLGMLERGRVDLALTILRSHRFESAPLFRETYPLAIAASHPLAHRSVIEAAELRQERMIVRRHCEALGQTSRHFVERGVRPTFSLRTHSDDLALALVRAGLGVTVMPASFRGPGVARPQLEGFDLQREIGLVLADKPAGRAALEHPFAAAAKAAAEALQAGDAR